MRHPRHTIHPMMATPDAVAIHATCRADTRRSRAGLARAPTNALAVRGRSAGDFARPAAIARSRGTGSAGRTVRIGRGGSLITRSEEHTSELQSHSDLVCRLLLEKKKKNKYILM